jgi:hypothetical protein
VHPSQAIREWYANHQPKEERPMSPVDQFALRLLAALRARHSTGYTIKPGQPGYSVWLEGSPGQALVLLRAEQPGYIDTIIKGVAPRPEGFGVFLKIDAGDELIDHLAGVILRDRESDPWRLGDLGARDSRPE